MRIRTINSSSTYKNEHGEFVPNPFIALKGKWVAKLGFTPGDKIKLYGKAGLILVKLIKP